MDSMVFNKELDIDVIRKFQFGMLHEYIALVDEAIIILAERKDNTTKIDVADSYQGYIDRAEYNKKTMLDVVKEMEYSVKMKEAKMFDIYLN